MLILTEVGLQIRPNAPLPPLPPCAGGANTPFLLDYLEIWSTKMHSLILSFLKIISLDFPSDFLVDFSAEPMSMVTWIWWCATRRTNGRRAKRKSNLSKSVQNLTNLSPLLHGDVTRGRRFCIVFPFSMVNLDPDATYCDGIISFCRDSTWLSHEKI